MKARGVRPQPLSPATGHRRPAGTCPSPAPALPPGAATCVPTATTSASAGCRPQGGGQGCAGLLSSGDTLCTCLPRRGWAQQWSLGDRGSWAAQRHLLFKASQPGLSVPYLLSAYFLFWFGLVWFWVWVFLCVCLFLFLFLMYLLPMWVDEFPDQLPFSLCGQTRGTSERVCASSSAQEPSAGGSP